MLSLSPPATSYTSSSDSGDSIEDPFQIPLFCEAMTGDYGAGPFLSSLDDDAPHSEPRIDSNLRDMYLSTQQFPDGALRRPKSFSSNQEVAYHAPNIQSLPHISTHDLHDTVDTSTLLSSANTEPPSAVSQSSHVDSPLTGTEQWSEGSQSAPAPTRQPKSRREKPHIELAPDQPPTTQGKARARVYVACVQWCVLAFI